MDELFADIIELSELGDSEDSKWVHAMSPGNYRHPVYGRIDIGSKELNQFADSVNNRVRGIVPDVDYDHKRFGGKAAGWIQEAKVSSNGLWLKVSFTGDGADSVRKGEYRYFSPEFARKWKNPKTGKTHHNVIAGGALTNRPFLKDLSPLKLEEPMDEIVDVLRQHLQLDENADENKVLEAIKEHFNKKPPETPEPTKFDEAKVDKAKDKITVTHPNIEGQLEIKLDDDEGNEELRRLAETNPAVKKILDKQESQEQRLSEMEAERRLIEVTTKLDEVGGKDKTLPPSTKKALSGILVKLDDDVRNDMYKTLNEIELISLADNGHGGGLPPKEGSNAIEQFQSKARELAEKEKITFSEAVRKMSTEEPTLYAAYLSEVEEVRR